MCSIEDNQKKIKDRIFELTDKQVIGNVDIVTSVSDFMSIYRGQVYRVEGEEYLIRGDMYEPRFGMTDQPKFWVKRAIDLKSGKIKIIKFIFYEEFIANIGPLRIRCYRNPEKESKVLELVRGDLRFMQGTTMKDQGGNEVRMIDFIRGQSLYAYIIECDLSHEEYYYKCVPWILTNIIKCFEAIRFLHNNNFCHGDIRNDHILIDRDSGNFRWIDFDLNQNYLDFDLWSLGNVLNFILGKGIRSFHSVYHSDSYSNSLKESLKSDDASAFYNYRIMNIKKLFPYINEELNDILLHFTLNTSIFYENIKDIIEDLNNAVSKLQSIKE